MERREHELPWERAFAQQVRNLREAAGMSQSRLARAATERGLRFHQQQVDRIERGERPVRLNEAIVLAQIFSKTLDDLVPTNINDESMRELAETATRQYAHTTNDALKRTWEAWHDVAGAGSFAENAIRAYEDIGSAMRDENLHTGELWREFSRVKHFHARFDEALGGLPKSFDFLDTMGKP